MKVRAYTGGGFAENGYLVVCEDTGVAVAVDPGAASQGMVDQVRQDGLDLRHIFLTHAHLDHVEGLHRVHDAAPDAPIWLHPKDRELFDALAQQAQAFGMPFAEQPEPTEAFDHGQRISFGDCAFQVRFAPGHAPGHVILVAEEHGLALVGDVIFERSIGRTDLPGGDFYTLMDSIRQQVLTLPDEMVLYTGHGPTTTVGDERMGNPFLIGQYGGELA
jgi:glyoxylase-like metal-dependent hydrolase (beta-lactamase superfamily II)